MQERIPRLMMISVLLIASGLVFFGLGLPWVGIGLIGAGILVGYAATS